MAGAIVAQPPGLEAMGSAPAALSMSILMQMREEQRANDVAQFVENLKDTLLGDVDTTVDQHMQAMWRRASQSTLQLQQDQEQLRKNQADRVAEMCQARATMEAESESLKQAIAAVGGKMTSFLDTASWPSVSGPLMHPPVWPLLPPASTNVGSSAVLGMGTSAASLWLQQGAKTPCETQDHVAAAAVAALGHPPLFDDAGAIPYPGQIHKAAQADVHVEKRESAAQLSLADALGFGSLKDPSDPVKVVLPPPSSTGSASLSSLPGTPPMSRPQPPTLEEEVDIFVFSLTLRMAVGAELGLAMSLPVARANSGLRIDGIKAGGAAEAWNRQCGSSGAAEKVLHPGDKIVRVNDVTEPEAMLFECKTCQLLRMQIVRMSTVAGDSDVSTACSSASVPSLDTSVSPSNMRVHTYGPPYLGGGHALMPSGAELKAAALHAPRPVISVAAAVQQEQPSAAFVLPNPEATLLLSRPTRSGCRRGRRGTRGGRGSRGP